VRGKKGRGVRGKGRGRKGGRWGPGHATIELMNKRSLEKERRK
jgi:hypothetical protein